SGFNTINPCGYAGLEMVRMSDLLEQPPQFSQLCTEIIETLRHSGYFKQVTVEQR
ncbi:octanoyltransferase, partial [Yersinia pestis]